VKAVIRKDSKLPKLLPAVMVATLALALGAAPALAHGHSQRAEHEYPYTATIDCGRGPVTVVSDEDLYAPLIDQEHHRVYLPIAWDVEVNGETVLQDEKPGVPKGRKKHATDCSYTDGVATGTVTVLGPVGGRPN
jgi:hypothetical protein